MAGLLALSINSESYQGDFLEDLFWKTFYHQHLSEDYGGLASYNPKRQEKIKIRTHRGLFRPNFANDLEGLEGTEGIGYCGPSREPIFVDSRLGKFAVCFSGNIVNRSVLIEDLKNTGHLFEREDDIEVLTHLIAEEKSIIDGLFEMDGQIEGAFSILLLSEGGIYAVSSGHWPLIIGEKEGAAAVASESGGFWNLGFRICRDLKPGEIVSLKNGHWKIEDKIPIRNRQVCSFLWVYTAFPNAVIRGTPVSLVRKRLGAGLARRDIGRGFVPDIVIPIPDSGRFHAIGYCQEFYQQLQEGKITKAPFYDEVLIKYPYAGRSFTPQNQEDRDREAQIKLLVSGENYRGRKIVVCDDSIVRGTQAAGNLVPKLRAAGAEEIHFRISNPELLSHCPWGKTTKKGETLASRLPRIEERIRFLGVDSLEYSTVGDLIEAIGLSREELCYDCSLPV